jgi:hypothetical protein
MYSIMREKWHGHRNGARQQNGFQMANDYNVSMINAEITSSWLQLLCPRTLGAKKKKFDNNLHEGVTVCDQSVVGDGFETHDE